MIHMISLVCVGWRYIDEEEIFESIESPLRQVKMWLHVHMYSHGMLCIDSLGQKIRGNSEQKKRLKAKKGSNGVC